MNNPLLHWLNDSILPPETERTRGQGFFAEFYPDGQLKLFTHCFNGSSDHSWRLELKHAAESGVAHAGSKMYSAFESYDNGYSSHCDGWNDDPPAAADFQVWVHSWINKIVQQQLAARQRDVADEARMASWKEVSKKTNTGQSARLKVKLGQTPPRPKTATQLPTPAAAKFLCPRCATATLQRFYSLELDPNDWDEEQIQLYRCDACTMHGIAWYQESRRGSGESWHHRGFQVSKNYWQSIADWIQDCRNNSNARCKCASHLWLKKQGNFPELSKHAQWFDIRRA
ncbi:MAG: hypothetical protein K2W95_07230 [Candidatus Obscuribacterales bacterium]|nr:hypothetical protein [Candidatus Obscuribacterales bacterium]